MLDFPETLVGALVEIFDALGERCGFFDDRSKVLGDQRSDFCLQDQVFVF